MAAVASVAITAMVPGRARLRIVVKIMRRPPSVTGSTGVRSAAVGRTSAAVRARRLSRHVASHREERSARGEGEAVAREHDRALPEVYRADTPGGRPVPRLSQAAS